MITVRAAVPEDAERIVDIRLAGWRNAFAHLLSAQFLATLPADPEPFRRGIAEGTGTVTVVAEDDGEVVGYALAGPPQDADPPRDWQLWHLYQYPRMHGSGSGQALLDAAIGDRPTFLWTAENTPRTQAFYRRNGFIADGTRRIEAGWEDLAAIRMVRRLSPRRS